jgi:hypothetical protein
MCVIEKHTDVYLQCVRTRHTTRRCHLSRNGELCRFAQYRDYSETFHPPIASRYRDRIHSESRLPPRPDSRGEYRSGSPSRRSRLTGMTIFPRSRVPLTRWGLQEPHVPVRQTHQQGTMYEPVRGSRPGHSSGRPVGDTPDRRGRGHRSAPPPPQSRRYPQHLDASQPEQQYTHRRGSPQIIERVPRHHHRENEQARPVIHDDIAAGRDAEKIQDRDASVHLRTPPRDLSPDERVWSREVAGSRSHNRHQNSWRRLPRPWFRPARLSTNSMQTRGNNDADRSRRTQPEETTRSARPTGVQVNPRNNINHNNTQAVTPDISRRERGARAPLIVQDGNRLLSEEGGRTIANAQARTQREGGGITGRRDSHEISRSRRRRFSATYD